jgi:hypothetical protein
MAYAAKRALFDLLKVQSQPGFPLEETQVSYRTPVEFTSRSYVFGGPVRFGQVEGSGEPGRVVVDETVSVMVIIVAGDGDSDVVDTDREAERVADVLADILDNAPFLDDAKSMQLLGFASGQGDYDPSLAYGRSTLGLEVQVLCQIL